MRPNRVMANLSVADIAEARSFYTDYLGLIGEDLGLQWVTRLRTPDGEATVQLLTTDATAPCNPVLSVAVGDDLEDAYEEAQRRGYEIVYPLTTEPWGLRRFFVRAPDGNVINVSSHPVA